MTDVSSILNILIAFGALQALFIGVVILIQGRQSLAKRLFSVLLLIEGISLIERLLVESDAIGSIPHFLGICYPLSFLKPPLLLLTALSVMDKKFRLQRKHWPHLIPFALILLLNIPFYTLEAQAKIDMVRSFMDKIPSYTGFDFYLALSFFGLIGTYVAVTISRLYKYRQQVKNNKMANWYFNITVLYAGFLLITLFYYVLLPSGIFHAPAFNTISMLLLTFLIQSIAYGFLSKSDLLNTHHIPEVGDIEQRAKDEQLIRNKLEVEQMYLDDGLNLEDFSAAISLPKKYVSELINQRLGLSFKDLISQYRVQRAQKLMHETNGSGKNLIDIAYDSGFNNKVTFYRTFKRFTGKSPSDYYKQLSNGH